MKSFFAGANLSALISFNGPVKRRRHLDIAAICLSLALFATIHPAVGASDASCDKMSPGSIHPEILNAALLQKSNFLCFEEFALLHSGLTKTSLWTAQHLTSRTVQAADGVDREDVFHAESRLDQAYRSELKDYRGSGYDRGHMAPAADMASVKAQDESFSLSNMIPQLPDLNRNLWSRMEATARGLARQYGEIYIVTGPAFKGQNLKRLNGKVIVPSHVYKAIYLPNVGQAGVWWAANSGEGNDYEVISLAELSARTGIDVFPALSQQIRNYAVQLPAPKGFSGKGGVAKSRQPEHHRSGPSPSEPAAELGWLDLGLAVIERLLR